MAKDNGKASQEGTPATNEEASALTRALDARITAKGLSSKIALGEAGALNYVYAPVAASPERSDVLNYCWNPASPGYIGDLRNVAPVISSHRYFAQPNNAALINHRQQLALKAASTNNRINYWQTEYCILGSEDNIRGGGRDLGMQTALYVARIIHTDIVIGNATSWQWWLGVSPSDYKDGLVYVADLNGTMGELPATQNDGLIYPSKLLWALGNYSRFIRPGMIRVDASLENNTVPQTAAANLMISAYKNAAKKEAAIVIINMTDTDEKISLSGVQFSGDVDTYTTAESQELKHGREKAGKPVTIGARSVVTLVGRYK